MGLPALGIEAELVDSLPEILLAADIEAVVLACDDPAIAVLLHCSQAGRELTLIVTDVFACRSSEELAVFFLPERVNSRSLLRHFYSYWFQQEATLTDRIIERLKAQGAWELRGSPNAD